MTFGPRVRDVAAVPPTYVSVATVDRSFHTMRGSSRVPFAFDSMTRVRTAGPAAEAAGTSPTVHVTAVAVTLAVPDPARGVALTKRMPSAAATLTDAPVMAVAP